MRALIGFTFWLFLAFLIGFAPPAAAQAVASPRPGTSNRLSINAPTVAASSTAALPPANLVYGSTVYFNQAGLSNFVLADLNKDGVLDLVAPQFSTSGIAFSFGDPSRPGTFLQPTLIPTLVDHPDHVTVADINGDTLPDILYSDTDSHYAGVLFQDPLHPGTFLPSQFLGLTQAKPLVADMNQDGRPDVILFPSKVGNDTSSGVAILLADPLHPGFFLPPVTTPLGSGDIYSVAVADMNGDGLPDIVVSQDLAQIVSILVNDSAHPGNLLAANNYSAGSNSFDLAVGDLNGDGLPDVVVGGVFSGVDVLLNNPAYPGTLQSPHIYPVTATPAGGRSLGVALGDVNGDGKLDVVSGNLGPVWDLLLGNGDGTLAPTVAYVTGPTPDTFYATAMAVADIDGDMLPDVLVGQVVQKSVQLFLHRPSLLPLAITATDENVSASVVHTGDPVTIGVKVTAFQGIPQGTITFYDSGGGATFSSIATAQLDRNGKASFTATLASGFHDIYAHFPGDSIYAPSTSLINQVVGVSSNTVSMTLAALPQPGYLGQNVTLTATLSQITPAPTGSVVFLDSGAMIGYAPLSSNGTAVFTTNALILGAHTLTATYIGDVNYASQQATTTELIRYPAPQLTFLSSLNPALAGQAVTFQTKLIATGPMPTGTVSFQDAGTLLSLVPLTSGGTAAFTTSTLTAGTHTIQATYSGDTNYSSQTATLTEIVVAPAPPPPAPADYSLSITQSLALGTVHSGVAPVSAIPTISLIDTISLSCGSLPLYVTCQIAPATLALSGGASQIASINIAIDQSPVFGARALRKAVLISAFFPLIFLGFPVPWRTRMRLAGSALAITTLGTMAGCGYSKSPLLTPLGTYSIVINGHGATSHLDRSATLTLVVE